jgi:anaerobic magnesium-protoporphyrin IX monomethyl ester cyclase
MKIVLIRPPTVIADSELRPGACPPLGLAYVAASLVDAGHEVSTIDAVGLALERFVGVDGVPGVLRQGLSDEDIVARIPADAGLIGVSVMFSTEWPLTKRLIDAIRHRLPGVPIVGGGEHITAAPEYVLDDCPGLTCCGLGEGEGIMVDLAETIGAGGPVDQVPGLVYRDGRRVVRTIARKRVREIETLPRPAWHLFPIRDYIEAGVTPGVDMGRSIPILASRGCPYECTFCSNPVMWGQLWRARDQAAVLAEMRHWMTEYGVTNFDFYDLTAIVRKDWIVKMARLIIDSGVSLTWQLPSGTRSEALDDEVVDLLYRSGCRHIIYAPESGSMRMLDLIKKRIKKDKMIVSVRGAVDHGIKTKANFIVGFPEERVSDVVQSYGFAVQLAFAGLHDVSFFPFSAYPGSEMFVRLERRGKVAMSDAHFFQLVTNPRSYDDHIPERLVPVLAYAGLLMFYAVSFAIRPYRAVELVRAIVRERPRTRLEAALLRLKKNRARRVGPGAARSGHPPLPSSTH